MQTTESPPQLWDTRQTVDYLGLSVATVDAMLRRREIPGVKVASRWYVPVPRLIAVFEDDA